MCYGVCLSSPRAESEDSQTPTLSGRATLGAGVRTEGGDREGENALEKTRIHSRFSTGKCKLSAPYSSALHPVSQNNC